MKQGLLALGLVVVLAGGTWAYKACSGKCCGFCPLPGGSQTGAK